MDRLKPVEHKIKALFFALFRFFLRKPSGSFKPLDVSKIKKILFLRPEKIGDMAISFPVFDGLKETFPHLEISILASPKNISLIKNDSRFSKIFLYTKNAIKDVDMIISIRKENYDAVVDMICDDSVTTLFLAHFCAQGKPIIGIGKSKHAIYYDFNYDHRMGNTGHIIDNTLKLLEAFRINPAEISCYAAPQLDDESKESASRFMAGLKEKHSSSKIIGYNLSAGSPTRIWNQEKSIELIDQLLNSDSNLQILLFTIPKERERAEKIKQNFDRRVSLIPNNLNLINVSAIIKELDLLITPDTSLVHIARSFKVSVIGLYSRFMKNFLLWKPFGQEHGAVVSNSNDNIHDITANDVFKEYLKMTQAPQKEEIR